MSSTTPSAVTQATSPAVTACILPVEQQQEVTLITAEQKLHAIYKAGNDFNELHSTVCVPNGGLLRGLLLGNAKSGGRSATVHELWNGRAKHDPLNSSLHSSVL